MRVTFYRDTLDARRPVGRDVPWPRLAVDLCRFRPVAGDKDRRLRAAPLWSPVELREPRRASASVAVVTALVLDYDDAAALPLDDALARWDGYERCGYTTWSHAEDAPRCRVVLPLDRPVPGRWWADLYRSILDGMGRGADPHCCDPSRAYYLPCEGAGGPHSARRVSGEWLDLYDDARELAALQAAEQAQREQDRKRRAAEAREALRAGGDAADPMRRLLATDPDARRRLAERSGAVLLRDGSGVEVARRAPCPSCGRADVWWAIPRGWARCNHLGSCGWHGSLFDYARLT